MQIHIPVRRLAVITVLCVFTLGCTSAQQSSLPNRTDPLQGITTSGQPDAGSLTELAAAGYSAVIDLRGPQEDRGIDEQAEVEQNGMEYISIPVVGSDDVSYENAAVLDRLISQMDGPVLIHCGSGNRAGALLALREKINGADNETALALGKKAGLTRLEDTVEQRLNER